MDIVDIAKTVAVEAHKNQVRKSDGSPYIFHPEAVASVLAEAGFGETVVAAAWVHDVLEDTEVSEVELRQKLGEEVVDIVRGVSEDKSLEWKKRKEVYIERVVASGESVKAVSVADKIHNTLSLIDAHSAHGPSIWTKFRRGRDESLWFQRTLCNRLKVVWRHPLLDRYEKLVQILEKLD